MSNNHPNDNIYSILGKLDALKPTAEEKHQSLIKEIRDSVEAKGSITEGVSSVEARLLKEFAEGKDEGKPGKTFAKIAKSAGERYGSAEAGKRVAGAVRAKLAKQGKLEETDVEEKAPPGAKAERMVKGIKKSLSKDGHLSDKDKAIAYATTWKAHNKGQVEEAYNPVKAVKQCAKDYMEMNGLTSVDQLEAEDIESIGGDCQMNYQDVCEILGCELPDSLGPVKSYDEHGDLEEGCTCNEGACAMHEAEITRTAGKTVHRKTEFPGYPADDSDDLDNLRGPGAGKRGRPRKHAVVAPKLSATGEKLGRGRPTKAKAPTFSKQADPFGRVTGAVPKGKKGAVHTMGESMDLLSQQLNSILSESRLMDDAGETLQHILNRFRAEVRNFEQGGDLDNDLYDALYDYYVECGEMPYGVQKARTGDPMRWVAEHLEAELGDIAYGKDPANAEGMKEAGIPGNVPAEQIPGKEDLLKGKGRSYYEEETTMEDELSELARLAGIHSEGNAFTGKLKDTAKGDEFELDGKTFKDTSTLDEEPNEGNAFGKAVRDAKADGVQPGEKVEVDGKTYPVKEDIDLPAQPEFQLNTSIDSDGKKTVSVNAEGHQAEALLQMLKMAGMGSSTTAQSLEQPAMAEPECDAIEEEGIEVDSAVDEPANAPNEKYGTIKQITTQGDDLNRQKKQDPQTANKAANPLTNAQQTLQAVAQLESKLAEEYESIKKVSK